MQLDLTNDQDCRKFYEAVIAKFNRVDILINCAGVIFPGDIENTYPQDYDYLMDINLRTPFLLTKFFQPLLQESRGSIVNVSCDRGSRAEPGMLGYCMAKAGLEMFTKTAALELAVFGIRVNAVAPGVIDTNLYRYSGLTERDNSNILQRAKDATPLHRNARAEDVAKAIIFLTSEK